MPPITDRDFLRVASQRLEAARALFDSGRMLDAQYLGGYVVECSIKAMIIKYTPAEDRGEMLRRISSGARMHRSEVLLEVLGGRGVLISPELAKRHRRFAKSWSTELRYEVGRRDTGETRGFLNSAAAFFSWAEAQLS